MILTPGAFTGTEQPIDQSSSPGFMALVGMVSSS